MGGGSSKKKKQEEERLKRENELKLQKEQEEKQKLKEQEEKQKKEEEERLRKQKEEEEQTLKAKQEEEEKNRQRQQKEDPRLKSSKTKQQKTFENKQKEKVQIFDLHEDERPRKNDKNQTNKNKAQQQDSDNIFSYQDELRIEKKKNQATANNKDLSLDLSHEMPPMKQIDQDLDFSAELSPIADKQETEEEKRQKMIMKISQVVQLQKSQGNIKKQQEFTWLNKGQCKVVSATFHYKYSIEEKMLKLVQNYNHYTTSAMQWQKNDSLKVVDFVLQDEEIYDLQNNSATKLPLNLVQFMVSENGQYIGIKEEQEFIKKVRQIKKQLDDDQVIQQVKRKKKKKKKKKKQVNVEKVIKLTEEHMKKMWTNSVSTWVDKDTLQKEQLINGELDLNGHKCLIANKIEQNEPQQIREFLEQQLEDPAFFKSCFDSKKTLKDRLKVWDVLDDQEMQGNIQKFKFPVLDKYDILQAIVEDGTMRPQVITTDQCKKIIIECNRDLFVDVDQEIKLYVFLWPEDNEGINETFFLTELSKFKDICDSALKQCVVELSYVTNLPLGYKPKVKSQFFSI